MDEWGPPTVLPAAIDVWLRGNVLNMRVTKSMVIYDIEYEGEVYGLTTRDELNGETRIGYIGRGWLGTTKEPQGGSFDHENFSDA